MATSRILSTARTVTAAGLIAAAALIVVTATEYPTANAPGTSAVTDSAAAPSDTTRRPTVTEDAWAAAEGVVVQSGDAVPDPGAVDAGLAADPGRLDAYVAAITTANTGRRVGPARWTHPVTYHIELPATYPAGVADEVRTAYRWMSAVTGVPVTETTGESADITVVGHHHNGGLTRYDAIGGELGGVTVQIGCCRRSPIWEEALHSMGLISDRGPAGSAVAAYELRGGSRDVPSAADATALRALYRAELPAGASDAEVRAALIAESR